MYRSRRALPAGLPAILGLVVLLGVGALRFVRQSPGPPGGLRGKIPILPAATVPGSHDAGKLQARDPSTQNCRGKAAALSELSPVEEAIVQCPFAPKAARLRLAKGLAKPQTMPASTTRHGMGWAQPDADYWRRMPAEARDIPRDWSGLPVVRFTNTEIGGVREVRLRRGPRYDQWLLRDPLHHLTACISVQRATRRVYFMQVARQPGGAWRLAVADDQCYSCHPSGPRVIRPLNEPCVDRRTLAQFNRLMLAYGACDFGDSVDSGLRMESTLGASCTRCHDGIRRGRLYAIHQRPIRFKVQREETMPPDAAGSR